MTAGLIDFSKVGDPNQPSPSVWSGCGRNLLNDLGQGHFVRADFIGDTSTLPGVPASGDGTTVYNDTLGAGRVLDLTSGNTDNNSHAIYTRPLGKVIRGGHSDNKLWYEARIAPAALTDQAFFAGLAVLDGLDEDILADDPSNSDQAGLAEESLIGFVSRQVSSETTKLDAVVRKGDGDVVTVLEDVTNSSGIPQSNVSHGTGFTEVVYPDEILRGDLVAGQFVKLGVVVATNLKQIQWYVNGFKVASHEIDNSVDQSEDYGGILALKTGAAADRTLHADFFRVASQLRT